MIKVYHKDAGIRSVTGIWLFVTFAEAEPTIRAYEEGKNADPVKYDFTVETVADN